MSVHYRYSHLTKFSTTEKSYSIQLTCKSEMMDRRNEGWRIDSLTDDQPTLLGQYIVLRALMSSPPPKGVKEYPQLFDIVR